MVFTLDAHVPNPQKTISHGVKLCNAGNVTLLCGNGRDDSIPVSLSNFSHKYHSKGKNY